MTTRKKTISYLLLGGILAPLLYIASDLICAARYPGYSYADQAISELSAIGAPTSDLWATLTTPYSPLIIAFGLGVILATQKWQMRLSGVLILLFGISGYGWKFYPMNMRGKIGSASDTGHLVMSALTVALLTLFILFGSWAKGRKFRIYSFLTIAVMLSFGALAGMQVPNVEANLPTPWMGAFERISVFSSMLWMLVLSALLQRDHSSLAALREAVE